jgi:hypothetical protein
MANNVALSGFNINASTVVGDTSPQLGGNLDLNSNNITGTGNINTTGTITSSGNIASSGTITGATFSGSGASLTSLPSAQLTGALPAIDGSSLTGINTDLVSDTTPQLGGNLDAQTNNITNLGTINTHTIPGGTGTLALTSNITLTPTSTDTFTNKTINLASNTLSGTTAQFNTALSDGSFRIGYQPGEIIEELNANADGRTVVVKSGSYTMQNVTATQNGSTTFTAVTGSTMSYTPPAGANYVYYRFYYHWDVTENSGISGHVIQLDGTYINPSAQTVSSNYASTNWHHAGFPISIEYCIDLTNGSDDIANGKLNGWTSAKTIRVMYREHSGSYESRLHYNTWEYASDAQHLVKPHMTIRAIA